MTAEQSVRVYPEQYDLFEKNSVSDVLETGFVEYYYSKNAVRDGKLEFVVEGNADQFIVLSEIYLKMVVEIDGYENVTGTEGRPARRTISQGARVGVVNNLLHSMFESLDVQISDRSVCLPDKHNPYIAFFHMMSNFSDEAYDSYFQLSGWSKDTAGEMEDITGTQNLGLKKRRDFFVGDEKPRIELIGKLFNPLFFQEKVLPTQVPLKIFLKKASDRFVLMHNENSEFSLNFVDAVLMVQKVQPVASLHGTIDKMLQEKHNIPYFLKTPSINYMTIEAGSSQFMRDNLFLGKLPKHIMLGMVETEAYTEAGVKRIPLIFKILN